MVTLNGNLVSDSSALLENQSIKTGPDSAAQIISRGSNVLLASDSAASYAHDFFQLTDGAILVTSNTGMSVHVGKRTFAPAQNTVQTKYEVRVAKCEITVVARLGNVSMPDGHELAQGDSRRINRDDCAADATANNPPETPLHRPAALWWLLGLGAAGSVAGVAILSSGGGSSPVSPSRP
jgi:hypothetical protein